MNPKIEVADGKVSLRTMNALTKEHGEHLWDGVLYNRDSITNPWLTILPNTAGSRLRRILRECYDILDA